MSDFALSPPKSMSAGMAAVRQERTGHASYKFIGRDLTVGPARRSGFANGEVTPARSNMIKPEMNEPVYLNFMKSNGGTENVGPLQVRT
jgi:hypothetical protein